MLVLLVSFSLASAIDTEIKVKTLADHKVSVFIYPSDKVTILDSFHKIADTTGIVSSVHSSDEKKLDVMVKVTKDGQTIFKEKFNSYEAGKPIFIRMDNEEITGNYNPSKNANALANTTNTTSESAESVNNSIDGKNNKSEGNDSSNVKDLGEKVFENDKVDSNNGAIAGLAVSNSENSYTKFIYYLIGIIILLVVLVLGFFVARKFVGRSSAGNLKVGDVGAGSHVVVSNEVRRLQHQLRDAQREIIRLKNQDKIKDIQKRIEEEKKELERLKRSDGDNFKI